MTWRTEPPVLPPQTLMIALLLTSDPLRPNFPAWSLRKVNWRSVEQTQEDPHGPQATTATCPASADNFLVTFKATVAFRLHVTPLAGPDTHSDSLAVRSVRDVPVHRGVALHRDGVTLCHRVFTVLHRHTVTSVVFQYS